MIFFPDVCNADIRNTWSWGEKGMWMFSKFAIVQFSDILPYWDSSVHRASEVIWMIWTNTVSYQDCEKQARKRKPTADSNLRLPFVCQWVQAKVQKASCLDVTWDSQKLSDVQSCFFLTKLSMSSPGWEPEHMPGRFSSRCLPSAMLWISQHQTDRHCWMSLQVSLPPQHVLIWVPN